MFASTPLHGANAVLSVEARQFLVKIGLSEVHTHFPLLCSTAACSVLGSEMESVADTANGFTLHRLRCDLYDA